MLLSDPEIESSILISSDEGATYQKYRLNFYIQSLLFHPKQEEWILAYSLDQKVSNWFYISGSWARCLKGCLNLEPHALRDGEEIMACFAALTLQF